jgi:hypothetical protein
VLRFAWCEQQRQDLRCWIFHRQNLNWRVAVLAALTLQHRFQLCLVLVLLVAQTLSDTRFLSPHCGNAKRIRSTNISKTCADLSMPSG